MDKAENQIVVYQPNETVRKESDLHFLQIADSLNCMRIYFTPQVEGKIEETLPQLGA